MLKPRPLAAIQSEGPDSIVGTVGNDSLSGDGGNDSLYGLDGNDTLLGGEGNDLLEGHAGADTLYGGAGNDTIRGADGNDSIRGDGGSDNIDGGPGNDYVLMRGGTTAVGGAGDDTLSLAPFATMRSIATGGAGADLFQLQIPVTIPENPSNDAASTVGATLRITDFNAAEGDRLEAHLTSLGYNDIPVVWRGTAGATFRANVGQSVANAGQASGAIDVWNYYDANLGRTVLFVDIDRNGVVDATDLRIEFDGALALNTSIFVNESFAAQIGTAGADADTAIPLGSGDDEGLGLDGNDTLDAGAGNDTLYGGGGNDRLLGGIGGDSLMGDGGADVVLGGAGADTIYGGSGSDTLQGGADNDVYVVDDAHDTIIELAGDGIDRVDTNLPSYVLAANVENLWLYGPGAANGYGNALDNTFFLESGNNLINGGTGTDTVSYSLAQAGVSLDLSLVTAQATGGSGNDTLLNIENLRGSSYADMLKGNALANVLEGRSDNDTLDGGGGNDSLVGGSGSDSLEGNTGNDTLDGGTGIDRLDGGAGIDTASYAAFAAGVTINLAIATAQATGGGSHTLLNIENLIGSAFADELRGNSLANRIEGGAGSDWIIGGGAADVLGGGLGPDLFVYASTSDSTLAAMDTLLDFDRLQGDRLDVSRIDANATLGGDQAFTFIGGAAFSADATGQLRYAGGVLYGSVDADADAEFAIALSGAPALLAADFLL